MKTNKEEFITLLKAILFSKGTGFHGEVYTNSNDEFHAQVWVALDEKAYKVYGRGSSNWYDASEHEQDFATFYKWFCQKTSDLDSENRAIEAMGDSW